MRAAAPEAPFAAALAILLLAGPPAAAQDASARRGAEVSPLLDLRGQRANVRYSPGSLERAARVQASFELLAAKVGPWTKSREPLLVYLLSREDWEAAGFALPYGFFARMPIMALTLPAWGDAGTVELWRGLLGSRLPEVAVEPLRGSAEEAASVELADLLADVEGVRLLLEKAGIEADRAWVAEVMAHSVAFSVLWKYRPERHAAAERLYATVLARDRALAAPPLADYRSGLSIENWLRFQARFARGARVLAAADGQGAGKSVIKLARGNGGRLTAAALLARWPELSRWLGESFAAE